MGCNCSYVYSRKCWSNRACTSVCNIAALCSLAASDSFSTSTCCLLSENWLVRVSSLVLKANSSLSFRLRSCFACSICSKKRRKKKKMSQVLYNRGPNSSCLECVSICVSAFSFAFAWRSELTMSVQAQIVESWIWCGLIRLKKCFPHGWSNNGACGH